FVLGNLVLPVVLLTQLVLVGRFVFGNLVLPVPLVAVKKFVFVNLVLSALLEPLVAVETFRLVLVGRFVFVIRVAGAARGGEEVRFVLGNLVLPVVLLTQLVLVGRFVFGNLVLPVPLVAVKKFVFVNLVLSALLEPLVAVETFRVRGAVRAREPRAARGAADAARVGGKVRVR
ncbi:hypothetical protein PR002_g32555, partial [Phytophthora rubi]